MTDDIDPDKTGEGQTESPETAPPVRKINRRPKGIQWERELPRLSADFGIADLARELGCSQKAVYLARKSMQKKLAKIQEMMNLPQTARPADVAPNVLQSETGKAGIPAQDLQSQESCNNQSKPVSVSESDLAAIRSGDPAEVEAALARIAAGAMAEGILTIPEPRTVTELSKWLDTWRKVTGRDKTAAAPPQTVGLIMPVRTLRRASGKTVETLPGATGDGAETDLDGEG